jgi:hypothetical protein
VRTPKLKIPLQDNFSRAALHNQGLESSKNGDRVGLRWFLIIVIDILMEIAPEQVL